MMDLGIRDRTALVCGSSKGLGRACAASLAAAGVNVVLVAREQMPLEIAAHALRATYEVQVQVVCADLGTEKGRAAVLAACPSPDILVNNSGGPPPGDFREWDEDEWTDALRNNMVAPILMIRGVIDGMIQRHWGRIVNVASYSAKMPLPLLGLSNGARSGLIGFVSGLAREVACHGITINNLLPGNFGTERLHGYAAKVGAQRGQPVAKVLSDMAARTPAGRIGRPEEFGAWCAFLASEHSGYVTAQNFVLDGGAYPGTY